jgi:hypothetical protein
MNIHLLNQGRHTYTVCMCSAVSSYSSKGRMRMSRFKHTAEFDARITRISGLHGCVSHSSGRVLPALGSWWGGLSFWGTCPGSRLLGMSWGGMTSKH